MVWGVMTASLQQRLVPDRPRGRVGSVFCLLALGGAALGTLAGGFLADATTLTAPCREGATLDRRSSGLRLCAEFYQACVAPATYCSTAS
jgi:hypothetical protein